MLTIHVGPFVSTAVLFAVIGPSHIAASTCWSVRVDQIHQSAADHADIVSADNSYTRLAFLGVSGFAIRAKLLLANFTYTYCHAVYGVIQAEPPIDTHLTVLLA